MTASTAAPRAALDERSLDALFVQPRSYGAWRDQAVPHALVARAWELASLGPTSANCSPLRQVLLRTEAQKRLLLHALDRANRDKTLTAPVVAVVGYDVEFWRRLPELFPHKDAAAWFRRDPDEAYATAVRNGTLQAGYFIVALRALGLDVGPISGFDRAAVQRLVFAAYPSVEVNFILNIGFGDPAGLMPRLPRLGLDDVFLPVRLAPPAGPDAQPAGRAAETGTAAR